MEGIMGMILWKKKCVFYIENETNSVQLFPIRDIVFLHQLLCIADTSIGKILGFGAGVCEP